MDIKIRENLLNQTKKNLAESTPRDVLVIQTIHTIDELIIIANKLVANLRERYGYYAPQASKIIDIKPLLKVIMKHEKELSGIEFKKPDLDSVDELVREIENLFSLKESQEAYLKQLMEEQCPELLKTATALIGARLISIAGSLKHLAELPSSTIQILGAEKALFRHIRTKAKSPRFGVIFAHQEIQTAKESDKARAARKLASRISIAVKKDYFRK